MNNIVDKLNVLAGWVGVPSEEVKPPTLWLAAEEALAGAALATERVTGLQVAIQNWEELRVDLRSQGRTLASLEDQIHTLRKEYQYIARSLRGSTSDETETNKTNRIHRILINELQTVEPLLLRIQQILAQEWPRHVQHVNHLTAQPGHSASHNTSTTLLFSSLSDWAGADPQPLLLRDKLEALEQRVTEQARALRDLEGRTEDATVEVDGEKFPSLALVESYVSSHNAAPHSLKFVDAMALLEMVTASSQNFSHNVELCRGGGVESTWKGRAIKRPFIHSSWPPPPY